MSNSNRSVFFGRGLSLLSCEIFCRALNAVLDAWHITPRHKLKASLGNRSSASEHVIGNFCASRDLIKLSMLLKNLLGKWKTASPDGCQAIRRIVRWVWWMTCSHWLRADYHITATKSSGKIYARCDCVSFCLHLCRAGIIYGLNPINFRAKLACHKKILALC